MCSSKLVHLLGMHRHLYDAKSLFFSFSSALQPAPLYV